MPKPSRLFQSEASSYGLTGIDSGGNLDNFDLGFETKVFHTLEAAGELNLRINSNFFFLCAAERRARADRDRHHQGKMRNMPRIS